MPMRQSPGEPDGLVVGIDTSAYTTSLAALDPDGTLRWEGRQRLVVSPGGRGLRQSEAVFQHVRNLPDLFEQLGREMQGRSVAAIGVSTRPRPTPDSYMPVFRVGEAFGRSLAALTGVPLISLSHQEGHIWAALWALQQEGNAAPLDLGSRYVALHLSGGTTELLGVEVIPATGGQESGPAVAGSRLRIEVLGGTSDLHAGQLVDRVGVALGLPFPAGPHLEALAAEATGRVVLPVPMREGWVSFSGPATAAERLLQKGTPPAELARAVERCISTAARQLLAYGLRCWPAPVALVVGGVAANQRLRAEVEVALAKDGVRCHFAPVPLSTDNAVGVAAGARAALGACGVEV